MPVETRMWEIDGEELKGTETVCLDKEHLLQGWLKRDIGIIDPDLLVIGEEIITDLGDRLDLLAIDPAGQLVVIELKKDRTPRDVVAQVLGYTAWVSDLTYDEIEEITRDYLERELADAFEDAFGEELPETINDDQRMIVVASSLDAHVERSLRYLSEKWSVDINAVFFRCFKGANDGDYLVRSWLEEPSEVERRKKKSGRSKGSTIEELREMAADRGAGEEFDMVLDYARDKWGLSPWRHARKLNFYGEFPDGRTLKVFGMYPGGAQPDRLFMDIGVDRLASFFGMSEDEVEAALPEKHPEYDWARMMSSDDIIRLAEVIADTQEDSGRG